MPTVKKKQKKRTRTYGFLLLALLIAITAEAQHFTTGSMFEKALKSGDLYHIDQTDLALADDATIVTILTTSNSTYVEIDAVITGDTTACGILKISEDVTGAGGTYYTPLNYNRDSSNTADAVAATGGTLANNGTTIFESAVTDRAQPIKHRLARDTRYAIYLENESGNAALAQLNITLKE